MTGMEEVDNGLLLSLLPGFDGDLRYLVNKVTRKSETLTIVFERLNQRLALKGRRLKCRPEQIWPKVES